jgi:pimeloyl-ACP methyl ester carboxylesterase
LEKGKITFMKIIKRVFLGLLVGVALMGIGFVVWAESPLKPTPEALSALESDSLVTVTTGDYITFQPANLQPTTGFIFYPGGRVDYRAYAPVLRMIAEQGYFVALVPVSLNLAFFDINAAAPVLTQHPEIKHWAVSGHSLGGVAASVFAKDHLDQLDGLVFFASYPADDSLKNADIKTLSIYGTKDMAGMEKFDETKALMPANTKYVVIEGGNHAQFGSYGFQPGDNAATISAEEQWAQITAATVEFLKGLEQQ